MRTTRFALFVAAALVAGALGLQGAGPDALLADAAERSDRTKVSALLKQRADVNAAQVDGMTALHWAVRHDDAKMAGELLKAGADVKAVNRYGVNALSLACTNGSAPMVDMLLAAGADPNLALAGGETPLMTASRTGSVPVVKALLAKGVSVAAKDATRGQTAVMWAAADGHAAVVQTLIDAGADYKTPLPSGFTPLLFAVREGRLDVVRVLIKAGVDVNETTPAEGGRRRGYGGPIPRAGTSPLLVAVMNAQFDVASALLDAGANPNADLPGYTALHAITAVREPGIGDNDPAPEGSGTMTSLEIVKKLVEKGANVDARMTKKVSLNNTRMNELGATPFLLAALTADTELMTALMKLGADPKATTGEKSTALMLAAGLNTRSPGEDAGTETEVIEALTMLLGLGADINAVDANGETAMHGAAYKNLPLVVKFLVAKGATIETWNRPNKAGWTPLVIAAGYRFGNFKPSAETEAAVREVMIAAGVTPPKVIVDPKTRQVYN